MKSSILWERHIQDAENVWRNVKGDRDLLHELIRHTEARNAQRYLGWLGQRMADLDKTLKDLDKTTKDLEKVSKELEGFQKHLLSGVDRHTPDYDNTVKDAFNCLSTRVGVFVKLSPS
jgi:hypothetical protein